jgi:hypothetical protein
MDFEELQSLNIFTKEQFETGLNKLFDELVGALPVTAR